MTSLSLGDVGGIPQMKGIRKVLSVLLFGDEDDGDVIRRMMFFTVAEPLSTAAGESTTISPIKSKSLGQSSRPMTS